MDDVKKQTDESSDSPGNSGEETTAETVARKVGAAIGTIASKVSGSQAPGHETSGKRDKSAGSSQKSKPSANAYEQRKLEIKKRKKTAHRRRLKGSHAKG